MSKCCSIIQEERSLVLGHKVAERVFPLLAYFQAEEIFCFLMLDAHGTFYQMLCEPWFKWEKGSFIWCLIELTLMSTGVCPEVGFAG